MNAEEAFSKNSSSKNKSSYYSKKKKKKVYKRKNNIRSKKTKTKKYKAKKYKNKKRSKLKRHKAWRSPKKSYLAHLPIQKSKKIPDLMCLRDNINFWKHIYARIPDNYVVIHDRNDLSRVYKILQYDTSPSSSENAKKLERVKKHYYNTLLSLYIKTKYRIRLNKDEIRIIEMFDENDRKPKSFLEASENIRSQNGLKRSFKDGIDRSLKYIPHLSHIVRKHDVPYDLLYLPHVESSYNPYAGSKVGAKGLWQIMPATMRHIMGRNTVHKRKDPIFSTYAAMKLLQRNYEETQSWPLALTAYNHGLNGILRAMDKTKSRDLCRIIDEYESPSFKFASSNFYAQFLAARDVAIVSYRNVLKRHHKPLTLARERYSINRKSSK